MGITIPAPKKQLGALVAASIRNQSTRYRKYLQDKLFEQIKGNELTSDIRVAYTGAM